MAKTTVKRNMKNKTNFNPNPRCFGQRTSCLPRECQYNLYKDIHCIRQNVIVMYIIHNGWIKLLDTSQNKGKTIFRPFHHTTCVSPFFPVTSIQHIYRELQKFCKVSFLKQRRFRDSFTDYYFSSDQRWCSCVIWAPILQGIGWINKSYRHLTAKLSQIWGRKAF